MLGGTATEDMGARVLLKSKFNVSARSVPVRVHGHYILSQAKALNKIN